MEAYPAIPKDLLLVLQQARDDYQSAMSKFKIATEAVLDWIGAESKTNATTPYASADLEEAAAFVNRLVAFADQRAKHTQSWSYLLIWYARRELEKGARPVYELISQRLEPKGIAILQEAVRIGWANLTPKMGNSLKNVASRLAKEFKRNLSRKERRRWKSWILVLLPPVAVALVGVGTAHAGSTTDSGLPPTDGANLTPSSGQHLALRFAVGSTAGKGAATIVVLAAGVSIVCWLYLRGNPKPKDHPADTAATSGVAAGPSIVPGSRLWVPSTEPASGTFSSGNNGLAQHHETIPLDVLQLGSDRVLPGQDSSDSRDCITQIMVQRRAGNVAAALEAERNCSFPGRQIPPILPVIYELGRLYEEAEQVDKAMTLYSWLNWSHVRASTKSWNSLAHEWNNTKWSRLVGLNEATKGARLRSQTSWRDRTGRNYWVARSRPIFISSSKGPDGPSIIDLHVILFDMEVSRACRISGQPPAQYDKEWRVEWNLNGATTHCIEGAGACVLAIQAPKGRGSFSLGVKATLVAPPGGSQCDMEVPAERLCIDQNGTFMTEEGCR